MLARRTVHKGKHIRQAVISLRAGKKAANARRAATETSPALSLFARPGDGSIRTRRIAILVADGVDVEVTLETGPAVLYDALAVPGGLKASQALGNAGHAVEFSKDQYRHCKPILALREGTTLVENAGVPARMESGEEDPGLLLFEKGEARKALTPFIEAIAKHRHFAREVDPFMV